MNRTLVALTAIAVAVFLVALFAGAQTVFKHGIETDSTITGTTITASTGFTGDLTGDVAGAVAATTITASSTTILSGAFDARSTAEFAGAVVCSSTVEMQGTASFADSTYFGNDVVATTFTGALTGNVTGNVTGAVFQTAALKGNLPTASENTGEFFKNTTGDTGWVADNDSWVQLWP